MKILLSIISLIITFNLSAQMDTTSYSIGVVIANELKGQGLADLDQKAFLSAIDDVLNNKEQKVSTEEAVKLYKEHVRTAQAKAGEDFLAENGKRKGVKTTASGLQYEVLEHSNDPNKPKITDKVNVHYHGTLINGEVFDSSVDRGEPISFPLGNVIRGWQEGLQLMPVGSKYRLFIPYQLAYGERGAGGKIGPFAALIFDVTLLGIETPTK